MDKHLNDSYKLRIPPELKERIAESAKAHNRSMNADIVARLEQSFDAEDPIRSVLPALGSIAEVSLAEHINRSVKEWLAEAKKQGKIPSAEDKQSSKNQEV